MRCARFGMQDLAGNGRIFLLRGIKSMHQKAQIMDENAMKRALMRLSHEIVEKNKGAANLVFVGIRRRGEPIAELVRENIAVIEGIRVPCGSIDIKFYRDDLSTVSESPEIRKASLPFDVNGRDVVLFDDVLYTGRTARAAIEAVFSCGRPKTIDFGGPRASGAPDPGGFRRKKPAYFAQRAGGGPPPGIRR